MVLAEERIADLLVANAELKDEEEHVFRMAEYIINKEKESRGGVRLPSRIEIAAQLCVRTPDKIPAYYNIDNQFIQSKIEERCIELLTGSTPEPVNNHIEEEEGNADDD